MSNGQPRLRTLPPSKSGNQAETLARLERLNDWTEEPARAAAASIGAGQGAAQEERHQETLTDPEKPIQVPKGRAAKKTVGDMPWSEMPSDVTVQMNIRVPADLFAKLKWLGSTTYESSITRIVTDSLQKTVKKMLEERGVS